MPIVVKPWHFVPIKLNDFTEFENRHIDKFESVYPPKYNIHDIVFVLKLNIWTNILYLYHLVTKYYG